MKVGALTSPPTLTPCFSLNNKYAPRFYPNPILNYYWHFIMTWSAAMTATDSTHGQPPPGALLADYISEEQAAAELGICRRTLQRWRRLQKGPPLTRIAERVMFRRAAVTKWLLAKEGQPHRE